MTLDEAHDALCLYTLAHPSPAFIHQHVVDAFAAQNADANTRPVTLAFALIGLYLHVENGLSGRQVQQAHQQLARQRRDWPGFALPENRGRLTVFDVVAAPEGPPLDRAIEAWCASVWEAFRSERAAVTELIPEAWRTRKPGVPGQL